MLCGQIHTSGLYEERISEMGRISTMFCLFSPEDSSLLMQWTFVRVKFLLAS
jgi:hypothetical protein